MFVLFFYDFLLADKPPRKLADNKGLLLTSVCFPLLPTIFQNSPTCRLQQYFDSLLSLNLDFPLCLSPGFHKKSISAPFLVVLVLKSPRMEQGQLQR